MKTKYSCARVKSAILSLTLLLLTGAAWAENFDLEIQVLPSTSVSAGPLSFDVYFYNGVDVSTFDNPANDLVVTTTGTVTTGTPTITPTDSPFAQTFIVEIPSLSGDGTVQLTIPAGAAVSFDFPADSNNEGSSAIVTVDNTAPTVMFSQLSRTLVNAGNLDPITFNVTPQDADYFNLNAADVGLTAGGDANALVDVTTVFNKAMQFNSSATYPNTPFFNIDLSEGNGGGLTMEAWVRPASDFQTGLVMAHDGFFGYSLSLFPDVDGLRLSCGLGFYMLSSPGADVKADRWQHVACTVVASDFEQGNGVVTLYIDGELVAIDEFFVNGPNYANFDPFIVGGSNAQDPNSAFGGAIDEARVWNVARTSVELQSGMAAPIPAPQAGLLAYWRFDEFDGSGDIEDFSGNGISLTNGGAITVTGSNALFGATVELSDFSGNGTLDIDLAAGLGGDNAGNLSDAVTVPETITIATSGTPPQLVSITPDIAGPTNANAITFRVIFNEDVSGFTTDDLQWTIPAGRGIDTQVITPVSGTDYDVEITLLAGFASDDDLVLTVVAGAAQADSSGLSNTSPLSSDPVRIDNVQPTPTISTTASSPRDDSTFVLDITFDESVTGFDASDIPVSNATLGTVSGGGAVYAVTVTPTITNGTVSLGAIPFAAATDTAGNDSTPSQTGPLEVLIDTTAPSFTSEALEIVTAETFTRRLIFSEPVTGLTLDDLSITGLTGTASGTLDALNTVAAAPPCSAMQCYDLVVINVAGQGDIEITLAANSVTDSSGLSNPLQSLVQPVDRVVPALLSTTAAPNTAGVDDTIRFTINASETIASWDPALVEVITTGGVSFQPAYVVGAAGRVWPNAASFDIAYDQTAGTGTVALRIQVGALYDAAGNTNTNEQLTPVISLDGTVPDLVSFGPEVDGLQVFPGIVYFEGQLSEAVTEFNGIGFSAAPVSAAGLPSDINSSITIGTPALVAPDRFRVSVDISGLPSGDIFNLSLNAGFISLRDAAGNYRVINDRLSLPAQIDLVLAPAPTLFPPSLGQELTNQSPFPVQIEFGQDVTGFAPAGVLLNNGTITELTGSGRSYVAQITPDGEGSVTVVTAEGAARSADGRPTARSEPLSLEFDATPPVISSITSNTGGSIGFLPFNLLVTVSEAVDVSALATALANGLVTPPLLYNVDYLADQSSANTLVFRATPIGEPTGGDLIIDFTIAAGAVSDLAGNPTIAPASLDAPITVSTTQPTVVDIGFTFVDGGNPIDPFIASAYSLISASELTLEFDFGEPVTGLDISDITIDRPGSLTYTDQTFELVGDSGGRLTLLGIAGEGQLILSLNAGAVRDASSNQNPAQTLLEQNISNFKLEVVAITGGPNDFNVSFSRPVGSFEPSAFAAEFVSGASGGVEVTRATLSVTDLKVTVPQDLELVGDFRIVVSPGAATDDSFGNTSPDEFIGPLARRDRAIQVGPFLVSGIDEIDQIGVIRGSRMILNEAFALNGTLQEFGDQLVIAGQFSVLTTPEQILYDSEVITLTLDITSNTLSGAPMSFELFGERWDTCTAEFTDSARVIKFSAGTDFGGEYLADVRLDSRETLPVILPGNDHYAIGESQACARDGIPFALFAVEQSPDGLGVALELETAVDIESEAGETAAFAMRARFERVSDRLLVPADGFPINVPFTFSGIPWTVYLQNSDDATGCGGGADPTNGCMTINPYSGSIKIGNMVRRDEVSQLTVFAPASTSVPFPGDVDDTDNTLTFGPDGVARFPREISFQAVLFEPNVTEVLKMVNPLYQPGELSSDESIPLSLPGWRFGRVDEQAPTRAIFRPGWDGISLPNEHYLEIGGTRIYERSGPLQGWHSEIEADPAIFRSPGGAVITSEAYESFVGFIETELGDFEYRDIKIFHAVRESEGTLIKKPAPPDSLVDIDMPFSIYHIYGDSLSIQQCFLLPDKPVPLAQDDEGNPLAMCGPAVLGTGPITPERSVGEVFCFFNLPPGFVGLHIPGIDEIGSPSMRKTIRLNPGCGKMTSYDPLNMEFDMTLLIPVGAAFPHTLDGSIRIVDDEFDKIQAGYSGFAIPLGNTGVYWTGIDIALDNLAQEELTRYVLPTPPEYGPPIEETYVKPVTFIGSATFGGVDLLVAYAINGTVRTNIDKFRLKLNGDMRLFNENYGPKFAEGKGTLKYSTKRFYGKSELVTFSGLSDAETTFSFGAGDLSGSITTSATIPKDVPVIGGVTVAELLMGMKINLKSDGNPAISVKGRGEVLGIGFTIEITSTGVLKVTTIAGPALRPWENSNSYGINAESVGKNATADDQPGYAVLSNFSQTTKRYGGATAAQSSITLNSTTPTLVRLSWQNAGVAPDYVITGPGGFTYTPNNVERNLNVAAEVGYLQNLEGRDATYVFAAPTPGAYVVDIANDAELGEYAIEVLVQNAQPLFEFVNVLSDGTDLFLDWQASDPEGDPATVTFYLDTNRRDLDGVPIVGPFEVGVDSATVVDLTSQPYAPGSYWIYALVDDGINAPVAVYSEQPVVIVNPDSPPAIRGIDAVATGTSVVVQWEASPDPDISGYSVLWTTDLGGTDFEDSISVAAGQTSTMITDLLPNTRYKFAVTVSKPVLSAAVGAAKVGIQSLAKGDAVAKAFRPAPVKDQLNLLAASMGSQRIESSDNLRAWRSGGFAVTALPEIDAAFNESLVVEVDIVETSVPLGENNAPEFVSEPGRGVDPEGSYQYPVQTVDRDQDNVSLQLVEGPVGMVLNGATVLWNPNGLQGTFQVVLEANDGKDTTRQAWNLTSAAIFPDSLHIVGDQPNDIAPGAQLVFDVPVAGGCGSEVSYRLLQAPAGMTISAGGRIDWVATGDNAIVVVAATQVCDGKAVEATREYAIDIEAPGGDLDSVSVTVPGVCEGGPSATVSGDSEIMAGDEAQVRVDFTGSGPWTLLWSDGLVQAGLESTTVLRTVRPVETTVYTPLAVFDTVCGGLVSGQSVVTVDSDVQPVPTISRYGLVLILLGFMWVTSRRLRASTKPG